MSTEIVQSSNGIEHYDQAKLDLLKRTVAQGTSDDEFALFVAVAKRTGLDPFSKQIYAIMRGNKMTIQVGIDGLRLIAQRSGAWVGERGGCDGFDAHGLPISATTTVVRRVGNDLAEFAATVYWDEYAQLGGDKRPTGMWAKMPKQMLTKCSEAAALRKGFPQELSGIYTTEEMDQAGPATHADPFDAPVPEHEPLATENQRMAIRTQFKMLQTADVNEAAAVAKQINQANRHKSTDVLGFTAAEAERSLEFIDRALRAIELRPELEDAE